jgi:hypothetical protein
VPAACLLHQHLRHTCGSKPGAAAQPLFPHCWWTLGSIACQRLMQADLQAVFLVDTKGLITESRGDDKPEHKKVFMRTDDTPDMKVRGFQMRVERMRVGARR